jgi:hypothetical protein
VSGGLLNVLSISSCLDACNAGGYRYSFVTTAAVTLCQCATTVEITAPSTCGLLRNFVYVNLAPVPSGTRKRTLEARKRMEKVGLCPSGLQSCRVKQSVFGSDDFEVSTWLSQRLTTLTSSVLTSRLSSSLVEDVPSVSWMVAPI